MSQYFSPDVYTTTSLCNDIEKISECKEKIELEDILNLTVKSLMCYRFPDMIHQKFSYEDTQIFLRQLELVSDVHGVRKLSPFCAKDIIKNSTAIRNEGLYDFYKNHSYAMLMHMDLASTSHIGLHIVQHEISHEIGRERFRGLDFGSGTGILGLFQSIQGRRNNFKNIDITGLEINKSQQEQANDLYDLLGIGCVVLTDTTKNDIYSLLSQDRYPITSIVNETVPNTNTPMSNINDPFYINIRNLYTHFAADNLDNTFFFPNFLEFRYVDENENEYPFFASKKNNFALSHVRDLECKIKKYERSDGYPKDVFQSIYPDGISFDGITIIDLEDIGRPYIKKGIVTQRKNKRR